MEIIAEQECVVHGIAIKIKRKKRRYDAKHLIVVFSGFGVGELTYDFEHALHDCPADVLWIKDQFDDHCTYYMCKEMDFSIEDAVLALILSTLSELSLTKKQCTLAGFSKGGSAALYFGLKHQFENIVTTVPQFHIGSFVAQNWPIVAAHMLGDVSARNIEILDRILPDVVSNDTCVKKNIYLLTSPADSQFNVEIEPNIGQFDKYSNFNMFVSKSRLVRQHNQVTQHNVPLLLGIFYSLAAGATPRYGYTELLGDDAGAPEVPAAVPVAELRRVRIEDGKLFPEGVAVLRGLSCGAYSDIACALLIEHDDAEFEIPLAQANRPVLTRELYDGGFVDYDKGWFCSYRHKGLNLAHIPPGQYRVSIRITCQGVTRRCALLSKSKCDVRGQAGEHQLRLFVVDGAVCFLKSALADKREAT